MLGARRSSSGKHVRVAGSWPVGGAHSLSFSCLLTASLVCPSDSYNIPELVRLVANPQLPVPEDVQPHLEALPRRLTAASWRRWRTRRMFVDLCHDISSVFGVVLVLPTLYRIPATMRAVREARGRVHAEATKPRGQARRAELPSAGVRTTNRPVHPMLLAGSSAASVTRRAVWHQVGQVPRSAYCGSVQVLVETLTHRVAAGCSRAPCVDCVAADVCHAVASTVSDARPVACTARPCARRASGCSHQSRGGVGSLRPVVTRTRGRAAVRGGAGHRGAWSRHGCRHVEGGFCPR